jgi:O-acetyl-ADP-ribose deacetylase (regulator of RNase III)
MKVSVVQGDLLDQDVDVIVNAWNRNVIPWWLLIPQGVSAAIKKRGGYEPFRELSRLGPIPLGAAVLTGAGRLPFKGIIHVAGINLLWFATQYSVRTSIRSAMELVQQHGFSSAAFPLIGSGSGSRNREKVLEWMLAEFGQITSRADVVVVEYVRGLRPAQRLVDGGKT